MNWIIIGLIALVALFFLKNLKHHLIRKSITVFIILTMIIMVLLLTSSYFDVGSIFSKESLFAKTGAAVVDTVNNNVDAPSINSLFQKVSSPLTEIKDIVVPTLDSSSADFLKLNN